MAVMDYQTQDGLAEYGFSIDYEPDRGWRVYIIFRPFHQYDRKNLKVPYQSTDDKGRHYVNWSEKIDSLGDARVVAALWAEGVQRYQHTQEQTAFYIEQIKQRQRAQARRGTTPAEPSSDPHESESKTQTAANATSEMAAGADGATATTPANSVTHSTVPPNFPVRHRKHRTPGALRHRRATRNTRRHRG